MAPLKTTATKKLTVSSNTENLAVKTMNTRSSRILSNSTMKKENVKEVGAFAKRKAASPIKGNILKRSALGNITNAIETQCVISSGKKQTKKPVSSTVTKPTIATAAKTSLPLKKSGISNIQKTSHSPSHTQANATKTTFPPIPKSRLTQPLKAVKTQVLPPKQSLNGTNLRTVPPTSVPNKFAVPVEKAGTKKNDGVCQKLAPAVAPASKSKVIVKPKYLVNTVPNTRRSSGRRSTLESTDSSLYVSALSDVLDEDVSHVSSSSPELSGPLPLPKPEINIDEEYANDPFQCAVYAHEIFEYLKSREDYFKIKDYMATVQPGLNQLVRAVLIDWMVEIQENFEMNHETLYLGVKLVDSYLSKIKVSKQTLQLVGATSMLIAAKYDERIPPSLEDFLYICDGAYKRKDIVKMEMNILRVTNFELGFPLSYRFLRRYARCAKVPMPLLTLARYVLEYTLMDYGTISLSDSKMAAAALYIAFKMTNDQEWDNTLIYFSGYRVEDFIDTARLLNKCLHQKPSKSLSTVRNKYSHQIFYEVATISLVSNEAL